MKCPKCQEEGKRSILTDEGGSMTTKYCPPFYDEEGIYHNHDTNTHTNHYRCSRGHVFTINRKGTCPSYPEHCDFHNEPEIIFENG